MNRTRFASPNLPNRTQNAPVPAAPITRAATVVTKRACASASIVEPMCAITITSAGDNPAIAPR